MKKTAQEKNTTPNSKKQAQQKIYCKYHTFTKPNGERVEMRFRAKTEAEAEEKRNKAIWEYEHGLLLFNAGTSVANYAAQWLRTQERLGKSLTADAASRLQRHIIDVIGNIPISKLRPIHLEQCLACVADTSTSNISKTWSVMDRFFQSMVREALLTVNPMTMVERPKGKTGHRRSLTEDEQRIFLQVLERSVFGDNPEDLFYGFTYACGLRPGEVRALTWSALHLNGDYPYIHITAAIKKDTKEIGAPKTEAGYRDVPIPHWFIPYILHYRQHETAPALYVFHGRNGKPLTEQNCKRHWRFFFNRLDLAAGAQTYRNQITIHAFDTEITNYYLRHTYRTNLLEIGINPMVAEYWMGHEVEYTFIGYAHITQRLVRSQTDILNAETQKNNQELTKAQL